MKRPEIRQPRQLLSEFSSQVGTETLSIRLYSQRESFICERRLVERDGSSFTIVLPFKEPQSARSFLLADPHYGRVRKEMGQVLVRLDQKWRAGNGKKLV